VNLALLVWFAARQNLIAVDARLRRSAGLIALSGIALAAALFLGERLLRGWIAVLPSLRDEAMLLALIVIGVAVYGAAVAALFGRQLLALVRSRPQGTPPAPPDRE
jgi:hypothetical protein